jgi:uncharacterized membrane protein YuzA (DUF378 family)
MAESREPPLFGNTSGNARSCHNCDFVNTIGAAACEHCGADLAKFPRERDGETEARLRAVAIWIRLGAFLPMISSLPIFFHHGWDSALVPFLGGWGIFAVGALLDRFTNVARIIAMVGSLFASLGGSLILFRGVIGFFQGNLVSGILAASTSLAFVFYAGLCLAALADDRSATICSEAYRRRFVVSADAAPPLPQVPEFWFPFVVIGLVVATIAAAILDL